MPDNRKPIPPNPPRWQPNPDPASIEIPGLDTSASPHDQIEQIEQLITLKLQNIDENFSKIHHLLSSKILPAVKRYAVGTEPVRNAAKFWVSFYEQAAQIRIPTYEEYSTVNEQPSEQRESEVDAQPSTPEASATQEHEQSMASTEPSFMPGQGVFSSTPATERVTRSLGSQPNPDDPSWSASVESPLLRLDREIKSLSEDVADTTAGPRSINPSSSQHDEPSLDKGKGREQPEPLLRNLLRHNLYSSKDISSTTPGPAVSPLRPRGKIKTPIPKELNPYLPPNTNPSNWSGIVNLRDPSVMTPQRFRNVKQPSSYRNRTVTPAKKEDEEDSDDDSFDGLPPGMSPPVLMSPARPPRSSAELGLLKLGQTPSKVAAARITRDLVSDIQKKSSGAGKPIRGLFKQLESGTDSSLSTVLTPPSLSRYGRDASTSSGMATDSSLASMMRQVGLREPLPGAVKNFSPDARPYEWSSAGESEQMAGPSSSPPQFQFYRPSQSRPQYLAPPVQALGANMDSFDSAIAGQLDMNDHEYATPVPQYQIPYQELDPGAEIVEEDLDEDDSYYDDEVNNTAHPSAAFLMASQNRHPSDEDDSFDSVEDGNSLEGLNPDVVPVHPFARGVSVEDIYDDDSFDDDSYVNMQQGSGNEGQSETLFGVPPGRREWIAGGGQELMLHGGNLIDTAGLTEQIGKTQDSPTPAGWNRNS